MHSVAVIVACLALGSCCWAEARAAAGQDGDLSGFGGMRSLKQGNACGNFDFKFNTDFPSGTPMNNGAEAITANSDECCALCTNTDGCKTWTRIKKNTRHNRRGECWLRDHTPAQKSCNHCDSGTVKDVNDFLDDCEKKGREAGSFAVRGACSTLTSLCPPPTEEDKTDFQARTSAQLQISGVAERTCKVLFENQCQSAAFDAVSNDAVCNDILTYGPGGGGVESCPDFSAALTIFESQLEKLCESEE
ncbi:hypothetical protein BSKO_13192 [Bryopsis sp. KO-2023]|nr:hypothetical protein BSKO_13192 [Bryopsis sp. KO-2023]